MGIKSLEVVTIREDGRIPPLEFLHYISQGLFATTATGPLRKHDQDFHFARLAFLESSEAELASSAAQIGARMYEEGRELDGLEVARHVDFFLSPGPRAEAFHFLWDLVESHDLQTTLF